MVGYLTLTLIASFALRAVEKKLDGDSNYQLAHADPLTMAAGTYSHPDRSSPYDEKSTDQIKRTKLSLKHGRMRGDR
jgi:putative lysine transport system permease protein